MEQTTEWVAGHVVCRASHSSRVLHDDDTLGRRVNVLVTAVSFSIHRSLVAVHRVHNV